MELTGKCKEDFEKWYLIQEQYEDYYLAYVPDKGMLDEYKCIPFSDFPLSMKWGVYQDFFDSVGLRIYFEEVGFIQYKVVIMEFYGDRKELLNFFHNRHIARTAAIEKANSIYNGR